MKSWWWADQEGVQHELAPYGVVWLSPTDCDRALDVFALYRLSHNAGLLNVLIGQTAVALDIDCRVPYGRPQAPVTAMILSVLANLAPRAVSVAPSDPRALVGRGGDQSVRLSRYEAGISGLQKVGSCAP